ncbi:MAG: hypothetical protein IJY69_06115 [Clostridia bacterium]|nr:hypothetical protein [Clostridia bacterium]
MGKWYKSSFFRNLVDMHIPDSNEKYLSLYNSEEYARTVASSGVDTAILYTSNCLGLTFFDEEQKHGCIGDRDIVAERIEALKKYGVNVVLYYNIWNREAAVRHPEWQLVNGISRPKERFRRCCINNEGFRSYVKRQVETLAEKYDFVGLWIDMIDWFDTFCVCQSCQRKLRAEEGIDIPQTVDYTDKSFAKYRLARERWLVELMDIIRDAVAKHKPEATVTFQNAAWGRGIEAGISEASVAKTEFLAGDFYGLPLIYSVICKFLNNATKNRPIEFMTSVCADLSSHTASKTDRELLRSVQGSLAHNTAFTFIDAIDPVGTVNKSRYDRMKRIADMTERERKNLAPDSRLISDVTYYVNHSSLIDYQKCPLDAHVMRGNLKAKMSCFAEAMIERHISYDVNVHKNLSDIDSQVIFLSDVRFLEEDEVSTLTEFVKRGGTVIATQMTGTLNRLGGEVEDFAISDLLGVHYQGNTEFDSSYIRRRDSSVTEFVSYDEGYPVAVSGSATLVRADEDVDILAYLTLPISSSTDTEMFSSAISDPPITNTEYPAITRRRVGKGTAVYVAASLDECRHFEGRSLLSELIMSKREKTVSVSAPEWLEVTVYNDTANTRYIVNCLNTMSGGYEAEARDVKISVKTDKQIKSVINITDNRQLPFSISDGSVSINLPCVNGYAMTEIKY